MRISRRTYAYLPNSLNTATTHCDSSKAAASFTQSHTRTTTAVNISQGTSSDNALAVPGDFLEIVRLNPAHGVPELAAQRRKIDQRTASLLALFAKVLTSRISSAVPSIFPIIQIIIFCMF